MPSEILTLTGTITEQRIDPNILNPVYNPFGDTLKPSTSRHIKSNYSRQSTVVFHHDRDLSLSMSTRSVSSVSMSISPMNMSAKQLIASQPSQRSFFTADDTKSKLLEERIEPKHIMEVY